MGKVKSEKYILWILLAAQAVLMAVFAGDILRERIRLEYDYTSLVLNSGRADTNFQVTYIDSGYDFEGYFAYTPPIPVKKGRYLVTVDYRSETEGNGFAILNDGADAFDKVLIDDIALEQTKRQTSFYIWVKEDLQKFMMATVYAGEGEFEVTRIAACETRTEAALNVLCVVLFSFLVDAGYVLYIRAKRKDRMEEFCKSCKIGFLLSAVIMFASMPLLNGFLISASDMEFHMLRIEGIREGLLSGQFPVRIQPTQLNGYGYPASLFYGDLFLYVPAVLRMLGMTVQWCYKFLLISINAATCLVMYFTAKKMFSEQKLAAFAAAVYTVIPYRLNALYVRAAVGEMLAYVFLPLIVYGIYEILTQDVRAEGYRKKYLYAVAGFTGIINSHVLTCEFVGFFVIVTCLVCIRRVFVKERFFELVKTLVVSMFLNAGFLVPFFDMMSKGGIWVLDKYTFTGRFIQGQGLNLTSLFEIFPSGNGIIYNNALREYGSYGMMGEQGMTIGIGIIILMGLVLVDKIFSGTKKDSRLAQFAAVGSGLAFLGLFMSLNIFPWDWLERYGGHFVSNIQFPWRVLAISSVLGVLAGAAYMKENRKYAGEMGMLVLVFAVIAAGYCMHDRLEKNSACYVFDMAGLDTKMTGSGSWNEYMPTGTKAQMLCETEPFASDGILITDYSKQYTNINMTVTSRSSGYAEVPLLCYRGYAAVDENKNSLPLAAGNNNVLRIEIPEDYQGRVKITYKGLFWWRAADIISAATLLFILAGAFFSRKSGKNSQTAGTARPRRQRQRQDSH